MNKFYDKVGFSWSEEDPNHSAKYVEKYEERFYYGDVQQDYRKNTGGQKVIDDIDITSKISILADPYAHTNVSRIRYICWMGAKWKVESVDVSFPRLTLSIGGIYNE